MRVLVVGGAAALANALSARQLGVQHVLSFQDALAHLDDPPDLLVTDDELDDGSGLELVARFRRLLGSDQLGILVLARAEEEAILRAYAAGASDCVSRSSTLAVQLAKCTRLLEQVDDAPGPVALPGAGETVAGRYVVESNLGSGGYGAVYVALDPQTSQRVALKILLSGPRGLAPEVQERFLREAYTLAAIDDPHVVGVRDFGRDGGLLYCALELVDGRTLHDHVRRQGACSLREGYELFVGLTRALCRLEGLGLVHRDIKPGNVVLRSGEPGRPVLIDFGLTKREFDAGVTSPDVILGSPGYLPPEALERAQDHRSDLFSLGQVVLFALRGSDAFPALHGYELMLHMSRQAVPVPSAIPAPLRTLLGSMVAIDPARRPASAGQVLERLTTLDPNELSTARPTWFPDVDEGDLTRQI